MYYKSEGVFSVCMTVFGLIVVVLSLRLGFGSMRQPEAGFFPLLIGVLIFLFGSLCVFEYFRKRREQTSPSRTGMFEEGGRVRSIGTIVCMAVWLLLLPWLGYIVATFLVVLALFKVMGLEGRLSPLLLSLGVVLFVYIIFDTWLYIDLPRGIFE